MLPNLNKASGALTFGVSQDTAEKTQQAYQAYLDSLQTEKMKADPWKALMYWGLGTLNASQKPGVSTFGALGAGVGPAAEYLEKEKEKHLSAQDRKRSIALERFKVAQGMEEIEGSRSDRLTKHLKAIKDKKPEFLKLLDAYETLPDEQKKGAYGIRLLNKITGGDKEKGEYLSLWKKYNDLSPEEKASGFGKGVMSRMKKLESGSSEIVELAKVMFAGDKKQNEKIGEMVGEDAMAYLKDSLNLGEDFNKINRLEEAILDPRSRTGRGSTTYSNIKSAASFLGLDKDLELIEQTLFGGKVDQSKQEQIQALSIDIARRGLKQFESRPTDKDFENFLKTVASLNLDKRTSLELIDAARGVLERKAKMAHRAFGALKEDRPLIEKMYGPEVLKNFERSQNRFADIEKMSDEELKVFARTNPGRFRRYSRWVTR